MHWILCQSEIDMSEGIQLTVVKRKTQKQDAIEACLWHSSNFIFLNPHMTIFLSLFHSFSLWLVKFMAFNLTSESMLFQHCQPYHINTYQKVYNKENIKLFTFKMKSNQNILVHCADHSLLLPRHRRERKRMDEAHSIYVRQVTTCCEEYYPDMSNIFITL